MRRFVARLVALFRRSRLEQELEDEIATHLEFAAADHCANGLSQEDARVEALRRFGGVTQAKEAFREGGGFAAVELAWRDLRYAVRSLRRTPGFAISVITTLALGIGANTTIFSLVAAVILRPLPVVEPDRLAIVSTASSRLLRTPFSYATLEQFQRRDGLFDGVLGYACCGTQKLSVGGVSYTVTGQVASGDFFSTLGIPALIGRTLMPSDDVPGGGADGPVAVISYKLWRERFGQTPNVLEQHVVLDRLPVTIVGVMPPHFFGLEVGQDVDIVLPFATLRQPIGRFDDDLSMLNIVVRLKRQQTLEAAAGALRLVQPQIRAGALPKEPQLQSEFLTDPFVLRPGASGVSDLREQFRRPLLIMFAVVAFVLLVACTNIGNLLLARGFARAHEMSVRLALGASRWRLARQLLAESFVLAALGAGLGLALSMWAGPALVTQLATTPIALDLRIDWRVLLFTAGTTITTMVLFSIIPSIRATPAAPMDALKEHSRGTSDPTGLSRGLVVAQVAISLTLIVTAGLLVQTFERLAHAPLGFDRDRALVVTISAPTVPPDDRNRLYHQVVQTVSMVPGVASAGGSLNPPIVGTFGGDFLVTPAGTTPGRNAEAVSQYVDMMPGWLNAYGTTIRAGRDVDEHDTAVSPPVILVNDTLVRQFFPGRDVIGLSVALTSRLPTHGDISLGTRTIVGVVTDSIYRLVREPLRPTIYAPMAQRQGPFFWGSFYITARASTGSPTLLTRGITAAVKDVNPNLNVSTRPLAAIVDESLAQDRLVAKLSAFFGALALLLAAVGLYGLTAYAVARQRREFGIRMALGADSLSVVGMVLRGGIVTTVIGIAIGAAATAALSPAFASLLFGIQPLDPLTFGSAALLLLIVAVAAVYVPARRATRVDPAPALRCE